MKWYDRVRKDKVLQRTGLTSLSHLLSRRRISVFGHVARLDDDTPANRALQLHINVAYDSTDLLTARGVAHLVVHGTSDSTRYETIPPVRLESSGGVLPTVDMVVQQRDDPRRLRDHDDDDGSSTGGGSTSVRGRIRSPHIYGGRLVAGSQRAYGPRLGQTDGQTDGRIAVSLNARLRRA